MPKPDYNEMAEAWEQAAKLADTNGLPSPAYNLVGSEALLENFVKTSVPYLWGNTANEQSMWQVSAIIVSHFGPNTNVADITTPVVTRWVETLRASGNSNGTINRKTSCLSKLMKHAKRKGFVTQIPEMPFFRESQGRIRYLTHAEEETMLSILSRWGLDAHVAYVKFLLYTGCRSSEAQRLEWRDVSDKKVTFWHTKTKKPRSIPLAAKAKEALEFTKGRKWERPWSGIDMREFRKNWNRVRDVMNLGDDEQFIPYALRHTCASRLVQGRVDIRRVKEWMGHTAIQMTMRYAHLAPDDLDPLADVLDVPRHMKECA